MRCFPRVLKSHKTEFSPLTSFAINLMAIAAGIVCILWLSFRASSLSSNATTPSLESLGPSAEMAWSGSGQMGIGITPMKINIEAYNKKREKDIAAASRKLLSLAIALKTAVEHDPDSKMSPDTIKKAKEIEKLAHDVKENMKINLVGPQ